MSVCFVGGSQRSGTTLLQTILCQDPRANPLIQEAKYLRHLVVAYQFGRQWFDTETRDYFGDIEQYISFNSRIVRSFLKNTAEQFPDTSHLVLREPHLTQLFPELAELLPKARFICVVRDPRDVVASMIRVGERLGPKSEVDAMGKLFRDRDVGALSRHFLSFYKPVVRTDIGSLRGRLMFLKYEDLVMKPEDAVQQLRRFTGIALAGYDAARPPDTGRVDYRQLDEYRRAWATEEYSGKVSDGRIGAWTQVLSGEEEADVANCCRGFMRRFGYS